MIGVWGSQALVYLAALVFVAGIARKIARYAGAPMHLRWELYPVPHEAGKEYGGSYMEELDWWSKPRHASLPREVKAMAAEILLLETVWRHNRKVWAASFPFHIGMYLSVGFILLAVVGGIAQALGAMVAPGSGGVLPALYYLTVVVGVLGMLAVVGGALGLLALRLGDAGMRRYSVPADYFNLAFIFVIALVGLCSWVFADPSFDVLRTYVRGLVTLSPPATVPGAVVAEVTLLSLFMIYMPFTHMTHFIGKYFTYHSVRWDDSPNLACSRYERQLTELLSRSVNWSAPHIGKGGKWSEVVTRRIDE